MFKSNVILNSRWLMPALVLAIAATPVGAQDTSHDSHHPKDQATATPAKSAATTAASTDATATMMGNMKTLQDQMAKIRATTDPKERGRLLDEHMKTMQDTMKLMMGNNGGCPMMGSASGGMMGNGNMMQMMMDQMMQHQNMMQSPGK